MANTNPNGINVGSIDFNIKVNPKVHVNPQDIQNAVNSQVANVAKQAQEAIDKAVETNIKSPNNTGYNFDKQLAELDVRYGKSIAARVTHIISAFAGQGNVFQNGQYGQVPLNQTINGIREALEKVFKKQIQFGITSAQEIVDTINNAKYTDINRAELKTFTQTQLKSADRVFSAAINKRKEELGAAVERLAEIENRIAPILSNAGVDMNSIGELKARAAKAQKASDKATKLNEEWKTNNYTVTASDSEIGDLTKELAKNTKKLESQTKNLVTKFGIDLNQDIETQLKLIYSESTDKLQAFVNEHRMKGRLVKDASKLSGYAARPNLKDKTFETQLKELETNHKDILTAIDGFSNSGEQLQSLISDIKYAKARLESLKGTRSKAQHRVNRLSPVVDKYIEQAKALKLTEDELDAVMAYNTSIGSITKERNLVDKNRALIKQTESQQADMHAFTDLLHTKLYTSLIEEFKGFNTTIKTAIEQLVGSTSAKDKKSAIRTIISQIDDNVQKMYDTEDEAFKTYGTRLEAFKAYLLKSLKNPDKLINLPTELSKLHNSFGELGASAGTYGLDARKQLQESLQSPFRDTKKLAEEAEKAAKELTNSITNKVVKELQAILNQVASASDSSAIHEAAQKVINLENSAFNSISNGLLRAAEALKEAETNPNFTNLLAAKKKIAEAQHGLSAGISGLPTKLVGSTYDAQHAALQGAGSNLDNQINSERTRILGLLDTVFSAIQQADQDVRRGVVPVETAFAALGSMTHSVSERLRAFDVKLAESVLKLGNSQGIYNGGKQEGLLDNIISQAGRSLGLDAVTVQNKLGLRDGSVESIRRLEDKATRDKKEEEAAKKLAENERKVNKYYSDLNNSFTSLNADLDKGLQKLISGSSSPAEREGAIKSIMQTIASNVADLKATGNRELIKYANSLVGFHTYLHNALQAPEKLKDLNKEINLVDKSYATLQTKPIPTINELGVTEKVKLSQSISAPFKNIQFKNAEVDKATQDLVVHRQEQIIKGLEKVFGSITSTSTPQELRDAATLLAKIEGNTFNNLAKHLFDAANIIDKVNTDTPLSQLVKMRDQIAKFGQADSAVIRGLPGDMGTRAINANKSGYDALLGGLDSTITSKRDELFTHLNNLYAFAAKQQQDLKDGAITAEKGLQLFAAEALKTAQILAHIDPNVAARVNTAATQAAAFTGANAPKQQSEAKSLLTALVSASGLNATEVRKLFTQFDAGTKGLDFIEETQRTDYKNKNTTGQVDQAAEKAKRVKQWTDEIDKYLNSLADFSTKHPFKSDVATNTALTNINSTLQGLNANHKPVTVDDLNDRASARVKEQIQDQKKESTIDDLGRLAKSFGLEDTLKNQELIAQSGIYAMSKRLKHFSAQVFQETFSNMSSLIVFMIGKMLGEAYAEAAKIDNLVNELSTATVTNSGRIERSDEVVKSQDHLRTVIAGASAEFSNGGEAAIDYARSLYNLGYSTDTIAAKIDTLSKLAKRSNRDLGDISKIAQPIDKIYGINNTEVSGQVIDSARRNNVAADKVADNFTTLAKNRDVRNALSTEDMIAYSVAATKMGREVTADLTTVMNTLEEFNAVKVVPPDLADTNNTFMVAAEALKTVNSMFTDFLTNIKKSGISTFFTGIGLAIQATIVPLEGAVTLLAKLMNSPAKPLLDTVAALSGMAVGFTIVNKAASALLPILTIQITKFEQLTATAASYGNVVGTGLARSLTVGLGAIRTIVGAMTGWIGVIIGLAGTIYTLVKAWQDHQNASKKAADEVKKSISSIESELERLAKARSIELGIEVDPHGKQFLNDLASGRLSQTAKIIGLDDKDLVSKIVENPNYKAVDKETINQMRDIRTGLLLAQEAAKNISTSMQSIGSLIGNDSGPFGKMASALVTGSLATQQIQVAMSNIKRDLTDSEKLALNLPIFQANYARAQANLQVNLANAKYQNQDGILQNSEDKNKANNDLAHANFDRTEQMNVQSSIDEQRSRLKAEFDKILDPTKEQREAYAKADKELYEKKLAAINEENVQIAKINIANRERYQADVKSTAFQKAGLQDQIRVYEGLKDQIADASSKLTASSLSNPEFNLSAEQIKAIADLDKEKQIEYFDNLVKDLKQQFAAIQNPTPTNNLAFRTLPGKYEDPFANKPKSQVQTINGDDIVKKTLDVIQSYADANRILVDSPEAMQIRQVIESLERDLSNTDGIKWSQGRYQSLEQIKGVVDTYKGLLDINAKVSKDLEGLKYAGVGISDPTEQMKAQMDVLTGALQGIRDTTKDFMANMPNMTADEFSAGAGDLEAQLKKILDVVKGNITNLQDRLASLSADFANRLQNKQDEIELQLLKSKYTAGITNPTERRQAERKAEAEIQAKKDKRELDRIKAQTEQQQKFVDEVLSGVTEWKLAIEDNTKALNKSTNVTTGEIYTPQKYPDAPKSGLAPFRVTQPKLLDPLIKPKPTDDTPNEVTPPNSNLKNLPLPVTVTNLPKLPVFPAYFNKPKSPFEDPAAKKAINDLDAKLSTIVETLNKILVKNTIEDTYYVDEDAKGTNRTSSDVQADLAKKAFADLFSERIAQQMAALELDIESIGKHTTVVNENSAAIENLTNKINANAAAMDAAASKAGDNTSTSGNTNRNTTNNSTPSDATTSSSDVTTLNTAEIQYKLTNLGNVIDLTASRISESIKVLEPGSPNTAADTATNPKALPAPSVQSTFFTELNKILQAETVAVSTSTEAGTKAGSKAGVTEGLTNAKIKAEIMGSVRASLSDEDRAALQANNNSSSNNLDKTSTSIDTSDLNLTNKAITNANNAGDLATVADKFKDLAQRKRQLAAKLGNIADRLSLDLDRLSSKSDVVSANIKANIAKIEAHIAQLSGASEAEIAKLEEYVAATQKMLKDAVAASNKRAAELANKAAEELTKTLKGRGYDVSFDKIAKLDPNSADYKRLVELAGADGVKLTPTDNRILTGVRRTGATSNVTTTISVPAPLNPTNTTTPQTQSASKAEQVKASVTQRVQSGANAIRNNLANSKLFGYGTRMSPEETTNMRGEVGAAGVVLLTNGLEQIFAGRDRDRMYAPVTQQASITPNLAASSEYSSAKIVSYVKSEVYGDVLSNNTLPVSDAIKSSGGRPSRIYISLSAFGSDKVMNLTVNTNVANGEGYTIQKLKPNLLVLDVYLKGSFTVTGTLNTKVDPKAIKDGPGITMAKDKISFSYTFKAVGNQNRAIKTNDISFQNEGLHDSSKITPQSQVGEVKRALNYQDSNPAGTFKSTTSGGFLVQEDIGMDGKLTQPRTPSINAAISHLMGTGINLNNKDHIALLTQLFGKDYAKIMSTAFFVDPKTKGVFYNAYNSAQVTLLSQIMDANNKKQAGLTLPKINIDKFKIKPTSSVVNPNLLLANNDKFGVNANDSAYGKSFNPNAITDSSIVFDDFKPPTTTVNTNGETEANADSETTITKDSKGTTINTTVNVDTTTSAAGTPLETPALKPEGDKQLFGVSAKTQIMSGGNNQVLVHEGAFKVLSQYSKDLQNIPALIDKVETQGKDTADAIANLGIQSDIDEYMNRITASWERFVASLKSALQSSITKLLSFPRELFKQQQAKADKLKEMTFQGASIEAQRSSLLTSVSDLQAKIGRAKTTEEYNSYVQQLQQVESSLRDINTQYAVWQESMKQTKEAGADFGEFFSGIFEDLGNQIMDLLSQRSSDYIMAGLFGDANDRDLPGDKKVAPDVNTVHDAYNKRKGLNPNGTLPDTTNTATMSYATDGSDVTNVITSGFNKMTDSMDNNTAVTKQGFAQSLGAALESIAIQMLISAAINIFRAAMTKRESDSKKFTAPLDFDTTKGTKNPDGVTNINVTTNVSGATASDVSKITSQQVDKSMNRLRFGV